MVVVKKGEPWELLLKQKNFPNRDLLLFKTQSTFLLSLCN